MQRKNDHHEDCDTDKKKVGFLSACTSNVAFLASRNQWFTTRSLVQYILMVPPFLLSLAINAEVIIFYR